MRFRKMLTIGIVLVFLLAGCSSEVTETEISVTADSYADLAEELTTGMPQIIPSRISPAVTGTQAPQTIPPRVSETVTTAPPVTEQPRAAETTLPARNLDVNPTDYDFITYTADFSVELFKRSYSRDENSLVSPMSVLFAMSMTANGARGETLAQMENVLGSGIPIAELNRHLRDYRLGLPSTEAAMMKIANSIWFRDSGGFAVNNDFLRVNREYYDAELQGVPFDKSTVKKINDWVEEKTDGMIDEVLDSIPSLAMMYLINAIAFDAQWKTPYAEHQVRESEFTAISGVKQNTAFMHSTEQLFIKDSKATGFIKPYDTGYSFAAILPNEGVSINDYISSMTGESLILLLNGAARTEVITAIPKFSYEYELSMVNALADMGITHAFDDSKADLTGIGGSNIGELYISEVLHKTFIEVDESGTKAAAVTVVEIMANSMPLFENFVILDRPFVYMIIDNETNLPVFIGVLTEIP